jgi:hypothetical protein
MNILIAVAGCQKHLDRWESQAATWAKDSPLVFFFTGEQLGVPDDYLSLPAKTKAICQYAVDANYDWVMKVDTDTYLSIPRALASGFENHDYMGYVTKAAIPSWLTYPYCSGPSYWLSKKACGILAAADWTRYDNKDGGISHVTDEDCMVGAILYRNGIRPQHDTRYVSVNPVLPENEVISEHLSLRSPFTVQKMYDAHKKALGL